MIPSPQNNLIDYLYSIKVGVLALVYSIAAIMPSTTILVSKLFKDLLNINEDISKFIVINLGIASAIIAFVSLLFKLYTIRLEYKLKQREYDNSKNS
jgi:hypothetical protein